MKFVINFKINKIIKYKIFKQKYDEYCKIFYLNYQYIYRNVNL